MLPTLALPPCRLHTFGNDTAGDIMAAASADVVVAVHGAGCTNWMFMGPGSALLEIRRARGCRCSCTAPLPVRHTPWPPARCPAMRSSLLLTPARARPPR